MLFGVIGFIDVVNDLLSEGQIDVLHSSVSVDTISQHALEVSDRRKCASFIPNKPQLHMFEFS